MEVRFVFPDSQFGGSVCHGRGVAEEWEAAGHHGILRKQREADASAEPAPSLVSPRPQPRPQGGLSFFR